LRVTPSTAQKSLLNCLLKSFVSIISHLDLPHRTAQVSKSCKVRRVA
jgi:hypothetical protein